MFKYLGRAYAWFSARDELIFSAMWFALAILNLSSGNFAGALLLALFGILHLRLYWKEQTIKALQQHIQYHHQQMAVLHDYEQPKSS